MSIAEWVRQALNLARRQEPLESLDKKLDAIRVAAKHAFPVGGIEEMLADIERGYGSVEHP